MRALPRALPWRLPRPQLGPRRLQPGRSRGGKETALARMSGDCHKAAPMMALTAMDKLLFWLGLGAAQKGARPTKNRHPVVSVVVGILIAVLIAVGVFILLISQQ